MAHGDAREGKWRGDWRMEWVASTLTPPPNVVYPALLKLMRTPRLPVVDWTDAPTDLNGLVRFEETRNLVSARVPSRSARAVPQLALAHVHDAIFNVAVMQREIDSVFSTPYCEWRCLGTITKESYFNQSVKNLSWVISCCNILTELTSWTRIYCRV